MNKQCIPRSDCTRSGSTLFAIMPVHRIFDIESEDSRDIPSGQGYFNTVDVFCDSFQTIMCTAIKLYV